MDNACTVLNCPGGLARQNLTFAAGQFAGCVPPQFSLRKTDRQASNLPAAVPLSHSYPRVWAYAAHCSFCLTYLSSWFDFFHAQTANRCRRLRACNEREKQFRTSCSPCPQCRTPPRRRLGEFFRTALRPVSPHPSPVTSKHQYQVPSYLPGW